MDEDPPPPGRPARYWPILLGLALLAAGWAYYDSTRPYLDCPDGHCPDPGSREYLWVVQGNIDRAPWMALGTFAAVILLGAILRALLLGMRALRRRP